VPNCGRGDIVQELFHLGAECVATDMDLSDFDHDLCDCAVLNFLDSFQAMVPDGGAIICMPPVNHIEEYVLQAMEFDEISTIAMLAPSMIKHKYPKLFQSFALSNHIFRLEVILTTKPHLYFYSWSPKDAKKVAKLDYSWFVWDSRNHANPTMVWEGKEDA